MGASSGCCLAGRLESGMIQTADKLLVMPLNEVIYVKGEPLSHVPLPISEITKPRIL